jgi:AraC-like DNA-binding protein
MAPRLEEATRVLTVMAADLPKREWMRRLGITSAEYDGIVLPPMADVVPFADVPRKGKARGNSGTLAMPPDDIAEARQLRRAGWTLQAIAEHLGASLTTVHRVCKEAA